MPRPCLNSHLEVHTTCWRPRRPQRLWRRGAVIETERPRPLPWGRSADVRSPLYPFEGVLRITRLEFSYQVPLSWPCKSGFHPQIGTWIRGSRSQPYVPGRWVWCRVGNREGKNHSKAVVGAVRSRQSPWRLERAACVEECLLFVFDLELASGSRKPLRRRGCLRAIKPGPISSTSLPTSSAI